MEYCEGFPEVSLESYDSGLQSASIPLPIEEQEEKWTMHGRMKVLELLRSINQCLHVFMTERLDLEDFDEVRATLVQRFEEKVTLLKQMNGCYKDIVKLRVPLALDPESLRKELFLPLPQIQEIQDLLRDNSPIKMVGIIREHNKPYINILTLFDESAIMVWIYRQNLVLNTTVVHTKLVPTGGMALKDLLQKQDVNNITIVAEFLSGQRKMLTSREDIISETCLLSIKMSAN